MGMIVREMILLDHESFRPNDPHDHNDDSGWLGPPRAVPFAWEQAPGTPKQERKSATEASNSTREVSCQAIVKVESGELDGFVESQRHSVHILDHAPPSFLVYRDSEASSGELVDLFKGRAVPFKWEMEPGIPRDPIKCRKVLDCPLTPPPVFHSRSLVVHSSRTNNKKISLSSRLRSLLWIHPQRKQHDFQTRLNPQGKSSKTSKVLMLTNSPHNSPKRSRVSSAHSDEEDLSPVSVLDYSGSTRSSSHRPLTNSGSVRLSSASSSRRSNYHSPQSSFSWDAVNAPIVSSPARDSFKSLKNTEGSTSGSGRRNSLSALLMRRHKSRHEKTASGCLMMLNSGSFATNDSFEESVSEVISSERSSSLSETSSTDRAENQKKKDCGGSSDDDARSVYYSPAPNIQSPRASFSFDNRGIDVSGSSKFDKGDEEAAKSTGFAPIERVDSLETIDPGFAPSEVDDDSYQRNFNILNRMTSCARWQRRHPSIKPKRSSGQLARSLFGRVTVCCYAPRDDQC